jgi:hypothetical protein
MFVRDVTRVDLGRSFLADPVEAVVSDLGESPSSLQTARVIGDLGKFPLPSLARSGPSNLG